MLRRVLCIGFRCNIPRYLDNVRIMKEKNKLRVFTAFSGYDSQCMALDMVKANHPDFDYELVGWSEIDKYAVQAHELFCGMGKNFGDISKIEWSKVPDFDLFTYSFPCTDISTAGLQKGLEENSGTRSSLLWECKKAIYAKHPKYLLMENVKALTTKTFMPNFQSWLNFLESEGYSNYWQVTNAKDYGIPQNRERVFCVSIRGNREPYVFPSPIPLEKCLADFLDDEDDVDESYYCNQELVDSFCRVNEKKLKEVMASDFPQPTPREYQNACEVGEIAVTQTQNG